MNEAVTIEKAILDYATKRDRFGFSQIIENLGINRNSARHYLSKLARSKKIDRIGNGVYQLHSKQEYKYLPSEALIQLYGDLKKFLPYADFCLYSGNIFSPLQHHLSINNAKYIETNRDVIDTVFNKLKETDIPVYKQPDSDFIYDYVDLQKSCFIIKPFVTEAPIKKINNIVVPSLEKIIVDIHRDPDLDYMRGSESYYMFEAAFDQYLINTSKLMRYARRRGCEDKLLSLIRIMDNHDR